MKEKDTVHQIKKKHQIVKSRREMKKPKEKIKSQ
jgi:hypothetical protein